MNDCKYEWKIRISRCRALIKEILSLCSPGERFPGSDVCPAAFSCEKEVSRSKSCKMSVSSLHVRYNEYEHNLLAVLFVSQEKLLSGALPLPPSSIAHECISAFVCHDANFSEKRSYEFSSDSQYVTQFLWHLTRGNWQNSWSSQFLLLQKKESRHHFFPLWLIGRFLAPTAEPPPSTPTWFLRFARKCLRQYKIFDDSHWSSSKKCLANTQETSKICLNWYSFQHQGRKETLGFVSSIDHYRAQHHIPNYAR